MKVGDKVKIISLTNPFGYTYDFPNGIGTIGEIKYIGSSSFDKAKQRAICPYTVHLDIDPNHWYAPSMLEIINRKSKLNIF